MKILQVVYRLVQSDSYATKRLFYFLFQIILPNEVFQQIKLFLCPAVTYALFGLFAHNLSVYLFVRRDIYYNNTQLFGSQKTVDSIVDDISCMLKVPRRSLHVVSVTAVHCAVKTSSLSHLISFLHHQLATSKGLISGDLRYLEEDGTRIDCRSSSAASFSSNLNPLDVIVTTKPPRQT